MSLTVRPEEIVARSGSPLLAKHRDWARVKLEEVAQIINGEAFESRFFNRVGEGLPLVRIRDVGKAATETFYSGPYEDRHLLATGDLLIGMDGEFRIAEWRGGQALLNQRVCKLVVRDTDRCLPRFLLHLLPGYLSAVHQHTSSVTVKHLSSKTVLSLPIPMPPPELQNMLVEEIEEQLSRLDAAVLNLARVRANLKRYRASLLRAATRGRPHQDHPSREVSLGDLVEVLDSKRVPVNQKEREKREGDIPYYGATGRVGWIDGYLFDEELVLLGEDGVQFFDPLRRKAYVIEGKSWVNNHAHVLRPIEGMLTSGYLSACLNSCDYGGFVNGTTRLKLTKSAMCRLPIPWVPIDHQLLIDDTISTHSSLIENTQGVAERSLLRVRQIRQGVLAAAFSGRLTDETETATRIIGASAKGLP